MFIEKSGVELGLPEKLKQRVVSHKNKFIRIFSMRYLEMLPTLFSYNNPQDVGIDFLKLEASLVQNYDIVIGEARNGSIQILGYVNSRDTLSNPNNLWSTNLITKNDIKFTIPDRFIPDNMQEISNIDNCETGNFTIVRNKTYNYVSDREIIDHYTRELAEIVLSRYSLVMQTKIQTFFKGDENDETTIKLVEDLYNGSPFVKTGKYFDLDENMVTMKNDNIASQFSELKREYQNKISELNNMLGINSLAVEKSSGVSDTEAKSNRAFTTSMANIKLGARNNAFKKLNKRYGLGIEVIYNDEVESEIMELEKQENEEGESNE